MFTLCVLSGDAPNMVLPYTSLQTIAGTYGVDSSTYSTISSRPLVCRMFIESFIFSEIIYGLLRGEVSCF